MGDEQQPRMPRLRRQDFINGGWDAYRRRDLRELKRAEKMGCIERRELGQFQCSYLIHNTLPALCTCGGLNLGLNILNRCPWPDVPAEVREGVDRHFKREMRWGQEWGK